jgi:DNA-binding transcriptional LysR family regulator
MASIVQLQYALELSRRGSFLKAAKKCYVTQPTLSMQIQKLEEEFGLTIFDRSRKPALRPLQNGDFHRCPASQWASQYHRH